MENSVNFKGGFGGNNFEFNATGNAAIEVAKGVAFGVACIGFGCGLGFGASCLIKVVGKDVAKAAIGEGAKAGLLSLI